MPRQLKRHIALLAVWGGCCTTALAFDDAAFEFTATTDSVTNPVSTPTYISSSSDDTSTPPRRGNRFDFSKPGFMDDGAGPIGPVWFDPLRSYVDVPEIKDPPTGEGDPQRAYGPLPTPTRTPDRILNLDQSGDSIFVAPFDSIGSESSLDSEPIAIVRGIPAPGGVMIFAGALGLANLRRRR